MDTLEKRDKLFYSIYPYSAIPHQWDIKREE